MMRNAGSFLKGSFMTHLAIGFFVALLDAAELIERAVEQQDVHARFSE